MDVDKRRIALQCGFDEVEIAEAQLARQPIDEWLAALGEFGASYQPGALSGPSIFQRRAGARP